MQLLWYWSYQWVQSKWPFRTVRLEFIHLSKYHIFLKLRIIIVMMLFELHLLWCCYITLYLEERFSRITDKHTAFGANTGEFTKRVQEMSTQLFVTLNTLSIYPSALKQLRWKLSNHFVNSRVPEGSRYLFLKLLLRCWSYQRVQSKLSFRTIWLEFIGLSEYQNYFKLRIITCFSRDIASSFGPVWKVSQKVFFTWFCAQFWTMVEDCSN